MDFVQTHINWRREKRLQIINIPERYGKIIIIVLFHRPIDGSWGTSKRWNKKKYDFPPIIQIRNVNEADKLH